ncbi:TPA: hypothetical protein O1I00_002626 [Staphylococcus aureus]|uniref:hypothetical protein n=1 Tax=Staphylococcus aureus TaxID=1280 RepID=UPI0009836814|nr:hypothetical protein [Staphylococcus aureus]AQR26672.1 hypothetical protein AYM28_15360 [Staphylococcus aureus]AQR53191.1 hypothetical protein AYM37_15360 [Staphylococcus aureus]HCY1864699.1 hypothetical protein [Staphylococcus aureus]
MNKYILRIVIVFIGILIAFPVIINAVMDTVTDFDNHGIAKRVVKDTKEVKGTVISSEDKSYKVKEPMFLFNWLYWHR